MADVFMPQLGETVADGTVTKWFKRVGDTVTRGEALFEVATDKVDTEIPAQADGVLAEILVAEGTTVDVGTRLAVIAGDGDAPAPASAPAAQPATTTAASPDATVSAPRALAANGEKLSPLVRRLLAENGLTPDDVTGTGPNGRITKDDVLAAAASRVSASPALQLSPVVRRLLAEKGLRAEDVVGTGPDGRVTRRDVEAAAGAAAPSAAREGDEVIPFSKIRKLTAEHMVRSKATSAHTLMVKEIDFEAIERVRRSRGAQFKADEGYSLTYLPFVAVATLKALREFPQLNASVGNDELIVHHSLNLGIAEELAGGGDEAAGHAFLLEAEHHHDVRVLQAGPHVVVDLDAEGLVVPVIKRADSLGLREVARSVRDLATRARSKGLGIDDMSGGTFTITNPGPYGTLMTGAVINQPQVAILSTDGVTRKPVVVTGPDGSEAIAIHSVGLVALTFDHRAVDGAYAARFLARLASVLQDTEWDAAL